MRTRSLVSGVIAVVLAAVSGCASGSPSGTAITGAGSPQSPERAGPLAACRSQTLGMRLQAGGYGGGNDFGSIEIWNAGPAECRLAGAVAFTAVFAGGAIDPNARPSRQLAPVAVMLPGHMLRPGEGADTSLYLVATVMGPEGYDPAQPDGSCRSQDELTPATLVLSIGPVILRIRNQDPAALDNRAVYGCHGQVLLEDLAGPQP
jgi:hypothetical protein